MNRVPSNLFHRGSIGTRLFLLVLLAVLPASGLMVYNSLDRQRRAQQRAEDNLLHLTQLIADSQRQRIENTRDLLASLARMPEVQSGESLPCHERLAAMRPLYPQYAGLAVFDLNGANVCASITITSPITIADRLYFQRAIQTQDFAVGEYQIGRNIGRPVLGFGYPVFNAQNQLAGVLITTVELATLNQMASITPLPAEAVLTIVDRSGLMMVREPGADRWIGQPLPEPELARAIDLGGAGVLVADGEDGVRRLYAYTPIEGVPNVELFVSVGLPVDVAYAEANQLLERNLLWAAAVVLLVLLMTWLWSRNAILRPVHVLGVAAERLRRGDLGARTGMSSGQDELSRLASAFDEMAAALAQREAALHTEREWLRVTLAGIGDAVIATNTGGQVTFMNAVAQSLTGWDEPAAAGRPIEEVFRVISEETRAAVESPVTRVLREGVIVGLANHTLLVTRDGREVPVDDSGAPIRDEQGNLLGVVLVFRDVTERRRAEAQLYAAKQLLDKTFASLDEAIFVVDPLTRSVISANPAVERVFGYRIDEVIGHSTELLHVSPERYQAFGRQLFSALDQSGVFQTTFDMRHRDGTVFPTEITVTEFRDEAGRRTGVVSVVRDITERQQAEAARMLALRNEQAARRAAELSADRIQRLQRLTEAFSQALTVEQVVMVTLNQGVPALEAAAALVWLLTDDGTALEFAGQVGYPESVRSYGPVPLSAPMPGTEVVRSGRPIWIESSRDFNDRYPDRAGSRLSGYEALALLPLTLADRTFGVLAFSFAEPRGFEPPDQDFALTLARQCAQALGRAWSYAELETRVQQRTAEFLAAYEALQRENLERRQIEASLSQANQELRELAARLQAVREDERRHLARELHDELGGTLTGFKMDLVKLRRFLPDGHPDALARLTAIGTSIDDMVRMIRRIATELRPAVLDDFGLVAALRVHFQEFQARTGLAGDFVSEVEELPLPSEAATACYRIIQEALTNVARHAGATRVDVRVEAQADHVVVRVADNGRGIDQEAGSKSGHLGLIGMRERAALISGTLDIFGTPGRGTTVQLTVPLDPSSR